MKSLRFSLWCVWLLLCIAPAASADDGFTMASLNPFAASKSKQPQKPEKTARAVYEDDDWDWAPRQKREPSTWDKVSGGTKDFFSKSKDVLMPWSKSSSAASPQYNSTGSRRPAAGRQPQRATPKKKSFLSSLLPDDEEDDAPRTVNDFLAQPRVNFD